MGAPRVWATRRATDPAPRGERCPCPWFSRRFAQCSYFSAREPHSVRARRSVCSSRLHEWGADFVTLLVLCMFSVGTCVPQAPPPTGCTPVATPLCTVRRGQLSRFPLASATILCRPLRPMSVWLKLGVLKGRTASTASRCDLKFVFAQRQLLLYVLVRSMIEPPLCACPVVLVVFMVADTVCRWALRKRHWADRPTV